MLATEDFPHLSTGSLHCRGSEIQKRNISMSGQANTKGLYPTLREHKFAFLFDSQNVYNLGPTKINSRTDQRSAQLLGSMPNRSPIWINEGGCKFFFHGVIYNNHINFRKISRIVQILFFGWSGIRWGGGASPPKPLR